MEQNESKHSIIAEYYAKNYDELKSYVESRLQLPDEAEDIVQNVFLRLLQSDRMISPITLPCLVYTMARNLMVDYWRRKHRYDQFEHYIYESDWWNKYAEDASSVYSVQEVTELLERGIARLSPRQCMVFSMNLYDGMKVSEIAQTLHLGYKNVENRLGSARKEVRAYMKKMLAS